MKARIQLSLILVLFFLASCKTRKDISLEPGIRYDTCKIIRTLELEDEGSKIYLLNICPEGYDPDRRSLDISEEENYPIIVEFEVIQTFSSKKEASEYAKANNIADVKF